MSLLFDAREFRYRRKVRGLMRHIDAAMIRGGAMFGGA